MYRFLSKKKNFSLSGSKKRHFDALEKTRETMSGLECNNKKGYHYWWDNVPG